MNTILRRGILSELDVSGPQHIAKLTGLAGETLSRVPRVKEFGFSSNTPPGAMAIIASLWGRSDNAMVLGLDHGQYGPRALGIGQTALYDAYGNIVSLVQHKIRIVSPEAIEMVAPKIILNGSVTIGGPDGSGVPVSRQGTVDSGGNTDASNFATMVKVV